MEHEGGRSDRGAAADRLADWDALEEAQQRHVLAIISEHAANRAKAERDLYASNFSDGPKVEVYRCTADGEQLVVDYLFHWWEWCPAQSGSDWNYHCVYRGTASFNGDRLERNDIQQLRRDYVHEYDEKGYDREAVLRAVRAELHSRG
jgi:hypothetical protein